MLRRIARFRKSGNEKSAAYLERCYERSQHAKTTALIKANADVPKSARLDLFRTNHAGKVFPFTPEEERKLARDRLHLLALADGPGMKLSLRCDEEVKILWKAKASGIGYRNMHAFGIQKRARHLITSAVMKPLAKAMADTRQFGMFGGGHQAAVARVKELVSTGSPWIIERDIINAFPSYDLRPSEITGYRFSPIPLPRAIIDHVLMTEGDANLTTTIESSYDNAYKNTPNPIKLLLEARRGPPQGSPCSALVQEMFVADLLRLVPDTADAQIVNCADNFCICASTKEDTLAMVKTLEDALAYLSAGQVSFSQKQQKPRHVRHGLDFLGYRLKFSKGTFEIAPLERSLDKFRKKALELATRFDRHRSERAWLDLRRYVRSFRSAYPHWTTPEKLHSILWFMFASRFRVGVMTKALADLLTAPPGTPPALPTFPAPAAKTRPAIYLRSLPREEKRDNATGKMKKVHVARSRDPRINSLPEELRPLVQYVRRRYPDIWKVHVIAG